MSNKDTNNQTPEVMSQRTEQVNFIHQFSDEETDALNKVLSDNLAEYGEVEGEKKESSATLGARLKQLRKTMDFTNRKLRDGYEERTGECSVTRDVRSHRVLYHLLETGELVKERPFEGKDYQLAIDDGLYEDGEIPPDEDEDEEEV